jgi:hypothetical protein
MPHSLPQDSSLWIENRPNCWRNSDNSDKDARSLSESRLLHNGSVVTTTLNDYAETGMLKHAGSGSGINTPGSDAMPAYAEVDQNHVAALTTFQGHRGCDERCGGPGSSDGSSSPAPYATTTLVGSSRQHLNGLVSAHTIKMNCLLCIGCMSSCFQLQKIKLRNATCIWARLFSSAKCHTYDMLPFM